MASGETGACEQLRSALNSIGTDS